MTQTTDLIKDGESLVSAKRGDYEIPTYDDGFGALYVHRNSIGISGIVRAQTWTDAYSICEDEFFPEADETVDELIKEYGFKREHKKVVRDSNGERFATHDDYLPFGNLSNALQFVRWDLVETPDTDAWTENELFQESFGFRPNGPNNKDTLNHGIYSKDLNGDSLDRLTPELAKELDIVLDIEYDID